MADATNSAPLFDSGLRLPTNPYEYGDAIRSFIAQTLALTAMTAERDVALAALARVTALCDSNAGVATRDGALMVSTIRAAMKEPKP